MHIKSSKILEHFNDLNQKIIFDKFGNFQDTGQ